MAEEKDTDPAPDEGLTESDSGTPETGQLDDGQLDSDEIDDEIDTDQLDALDEREAEFDDVDEAAENQDSSEDDELVGVGAATKSRAGETEASGSATGRGRKGRATAKQRTRKESARRGGPVSFVQGSVSELKKVVYPTWPQLVNYFVVVLVFVLIIIGIVAGLDYGIGWLMLRVFS